MKAGLCAVCMHRREIRSKRGSSFLLCRRSLTDPRSGAIPPSRFSAVPGSSPATPTPGVTRVTRVRTGDAQVGEDEAPGGADVR
jgi:hypothetical protein